MYDQICQNMTLVGKPINFFNNYILMLILIIPYVEEMFLN